MKDYSDDNSSFIDFNQKENDLLDKPIHFTNRCFARRNSMFEGFFLPPDSQVLCYRTINTNQKPNSNQNKLQQEDNSQIESKFEQEPNETEEEKSIYDSCLLCNWAFPIEMINQERYNHIIICSEGEGKGKENIENYLLSKATALKTADKSDRTIEGTLCIFCNKRFKTAKLTHLNYCVEKYLRLNKQY